VVAEHVALTLIFLDFIIYSVGGVIGMMHHMYFNGTPVEAMALGAVFSAMEVVPLTFLTVEAWSFLQLGAVQGEGARTPFPHRWAVMFRLCRKVDSNFLLPTIYAIFRVPSFQYVVRFVNWATEPPRVPEETNPINCGEAR
jgi:hypothetical protein